MSLSVRPITAEQHVEVIRSVPSVSFLQTPAWATVKNEWQGESIGWFEVGSDTPVAAALVLYRQLPRLKRYLAYLPEGPAIDWSGVTDAAGLARWIDPMVAHLKSSGAFGVRMGPAVVQRRWHAPTIKTAIADPALTTLGQAPADEVDDGAVALTSLLSSAGWREVGTDDGFSAGQPKYNFWLPLQGKDDDALLAGMNQLWRRNIRKAAKAGVEVTLGDRAAIADFHRIYLETAERDHFTPRPLAYFERMWDALTGEDPDRMRLYLGHHEGDLVAATTLVRVGEHAWYSYGASTTHKRDVRGSNAVQWQMIQDSAAAGASVYDLRGITDTIAEGDPHLGLIQFKVGTGGQAVEYLGEWDLPLNRALYLGFTQYLKRR